ncbi:hypothetical protein PHSY_001802 [Pseudozyma hubeiensis SY62]|uniref:mRNA splicing factor n=1 Tax=Pseudozyma hubeiensis (strain SY62) TaxID=1305764 RepID=R9NZL6_PSEHS|nr:hypothetical protein PHSY_001802 [Pseudozyma hubeiensis SY62]GAC94231.1 hypothetical protein PHSY_001802 [Pseudozyma hubeiensis SY62]
MSLEEFSAARKQKLSLLRSLREAEQSSTPLPSSSSTSLRQASLIKRHFRNYDPITGQMKRFTSARDLPDTVEKDVDGLQQRIISDDEQKRQEELDLNNIAPKRANWDLKRDLQRRLKKLERRDKEAVILLIRQRIQSQQKAAGLNADDGNEHSVTGLSAEIAATATADLGSAESDPSNDEGGSDDD